MYNLTAVYQTNIIAMVLMLIIMLNMKKNVSLRSLSDKLFFALALAIFVGSCFEITGYAFDFQTYTGAKTLNRVFNALLFIISPFSAYIWALYTHYIVFNDKKNLYRVAKIITIPILIIMVLGIANMYVDIFFTITEANEYKRGDFFFVATLLNIFYLVYATFLIITQKDNISKTTYIPMICFMILPLSGFFLQVFFYGQSLMWIGNATGILIVYNSVQNNYTNKDWLTRVYNRRHFDYYLGTKCKQKKSKKLAGMMMDLNGFKQINDTYGHLEGDFALQKTAQILKDALGYKRYLARYAGDEFISIFEIDNASEILSTIDFIQKDFQSFNRTSGKDYNITLSIGYTILNDGQTPVDFIKVMDANMYKDKEHKHNLLH